MDQTQCFVCGDDCSKSSCFLVNQQSKKYKAKYTSLIGNFVASEYELRVGATDKVCSRCVVLIERYDELHHETMTIKSVLSRQMAFRYGIETDQEQVFLDKSKVFFPLRNVGTEKFTCKHCPNFLADNIDVINAHILYHQYLFEEKNAIERPQPVATKNVVKTITREVPKKQIEDVKVTKLQPAIKPQDPVKLHSFSAAQECDEDTLESLIDLNLLENEFYDSNLKDNSCTVKTCNETFRYACDYVRHLKCHHRLTHNQIIAIFRTNLKKPVKISKFTCPFCFTIMNDYDDLQEHLKVHEDVEKPTIFANRLNTFFSGLIAASKCKICDYALLDPSATECDHEIARNGMARKFNCKHCHAYFYNERLYNNHLAMQHFECFNCGMRCENKLYLRDHIKSHMIHTEYPCSFCSEIYQTSNDRKAHVRTKHNNNCCLHCGEFFTELTELDMHCKLSHADKKFKENPVVCDTCGVTSKSRTLYNKHIQTEHKGAKRIFKCSKCQQTFEFRFLLMDHIATAHNFTIVDNETNFYRCCYCPESFSSQNRKNFMTHLQKHQWNETLCHDCDLNLKTRSMYDDHREKCHQDFSKVVHKTLMLPKQGKIDEPVGVKGKAHDQLKEMEVGKKNQVVNEPIQELPTTNIQLVQEQQPPQQQVLIQGEDGSLLNMNNLILTENGELIIQNFDGLLPNGVSGQDGEIQINNLEQFLLEQGISANTEISYIQSDDGTMVIQNDDGSLTHTTQESLLQTYKEIFEPDEIPQELIGEAEVVNQSEVIDQQNILMNGDYIIQTQPQTQPQNTAENQAVNAANQSTLDELGDILVEVAAAAEKEKKPKIADNSMKEQLWGKKRVFTTAKDSPLKRKNGRQAEPNSSNEPPAQNFSQAYEYFVRGFDAKKMKPN